LPEVIGYEEIEISKIKTSAWTLRSEAYVDPNFVKSVKEALIEPIVVRKVGDNSYELVCGKRRKIGAEDAGMSKILCKVMLLSDSEAWVMMLQENLQREDVPPMDIAASILFAMAEFKLTQEEAGRKLHLKKESVSNLLRVARHPLLSEKVKKGDHSLQAALELLAKMPKKADPEEWVIWESFVDKTVS